MDSRYLTVLIRRCRTEAKIKSVPMMSMSLARRWSTEVMEKSSFFFCQWVDLGENLQETGDFPMKYGIFL